MKTVDHIAIRVPDLDLAQTWYEKYCGAVLSFKDQYYRRMTLNNTTIALIDENRYPDNHIGLLVENVEDLPSFGTIIEHRDGTIGSYVKDPFGNMVEYIWYSDEAKKKLNGA